MFTFIFEYKEIVAILISDKKDFIAMAIKIDKEWKYIILKELVQQEAIALVNIYAPNIVAHKYIKMLLDFKGDIDNNTTIVREFNTPLTSLDWSPRQ